MIVTGPTRSTEINGETPVGAIDGANVIFFTAYPFRPRTERVYVNGVRQKRDEDYAVNSTTSFILSSPLQTGDTVLVDYAR